MYLILCFIFYWIISKCLISFITSLYDMTYGYIASIGPMCSCVTTVKEP